MLSSASKGLDDLFFSSPETAQLVLNTYRLLCDVARSSPVWIQLVRNIFVSLEPAVHKSCCHLVLMLQDSRSHSIFTFSMPSRFSRAPLYHHVSHPFSKLRNSTFSVHESHFMVVPCCLFLLLFFTVLVIVESERLQPPTLGRIVELHSSVMFSSAPPLIPNTWFSIYCWTDGTNVFRELL